MNSPLPLPDWLQEPEPDLPHDVPSPKDRPMHVPLPLSQMSNEDRKLELQTFAIAFESSLEQIAAGVTVEQFAQRYTDPLGRPLSHGRFRAWIYRDEKRRNAFYAAKALAAEAIEDELLRISDGMLLDGSASPDDTARSTLRIQTRWKLLQVYNRKRYGDVKQVEQTVTSRIDVSTMNARQLEERLLKALGVDALDGPDGSDGSPNNLFDAATDVDVDAA